MDDSKLYEWKNAVRIPLSGHGSYGPIAEKLLSVCNAGSDIEIIYDGGSTPGTSRRIHPYQLFKVQGYSSIYVEAYCHKREDYRTFRLDKIRLSHPAYTKDKFRTPTSPTATRSSGTGCLVYVVGVIILTILVSVIIIWMIAL